jgi:hypothetical protein
VPAARKVCVLHLLPCFRSESDATIFGHSPTLMRILCSQIHRAQVDLPYSEAWMDRELMLKQASAELAAAEK